MFRNKKQKSNSFGTFHKHNSWQKRKQVFGYAVLLLVLVIAAVVGIGRKIEQKKNKQIKVAETKSDASGLPGWWLRQYFGQGVCEKDICKPDADPDADGLTNSQEFYYHSNPMKADTNGNGINDGKMVALGFDPSVPGKVPFDEVASEDNVLGESVVFDKDLIRTLGDMASFQNIQIPQVAENEIKISKDNTRDSILAYLKTSNDIIGKYFPKNSSAAIQQAMSSEDSVTLNEFSIDSVKAAGELKQLTVPSDAVTIHKYQLGMLTLLPSVITMPSDQSITDPTSKEANAWYDSARSFSYLLQQISIETAKLQNKYQ